MVGTGIFATCPRCGDRRDLMRVPGIKTPWPHCLQCDEMMNVFVPRRLYTERRPSHDVEDVRDQQPVRHRIDIGLGADSKRATA